MSINKEGQRIPKANFHILRGHESIDRTTDDIFKGKTVIVFALPGAFTPTCSSTHVPRFNQLTPLLKQHGVDDVVCLSVNDKFVMGQWQKDQKANNLTFIPDGNGDFSREMGMLSEKFALGMGKRSKRYSMLVKDGIIDKMFIESDELGKGFEVSDADTMLNYLAPQALKPIDATIFSREGCSFCVRAKEMLNNAGIEFDELILNKDFKESTIRSVSGKSTVPQVFINGSLIGGSEALEAYLATSNN